MLMVVMLHYLGSANLMQSRVGLWTTNWFIVQLIGGTHWVCVNCFVLISGYFMCTSNFRLSKWMHIWAETFFYSLLLYFTLVALGLLPFSASQLIKNGLNVTLRRYWFVTDYLLLYAASPFLNLMIKAMSQKMHLLCCSLTLLTFCVLHNIFYVCDFAGVSDGFSLLWFFSLYIIAAYIRMYLPAGTVRRKWSILIYIVCSLTLVVSRCLAYWITPKIFGQPTLTHLFHTYNSIPVALGSIALFLFFRETKIHAPLLNKAIAWAAPVSFSVYLLHHHLDFKPFLWSWLDAPRYDASFWMLPRAIVIVFSIFIICCLLDYARRWLFRKCGIDCLIDKFSNWVEKKTGFILSKVTKSPTDSQQAPVSHHNK